MSKRLVTNIVLAIFTIALFVFEEQWPSGVVILIIYNFYQSYEKLAVQIVEQYFKLFFTFGFIGAPYLILTEGFGYTDKRAAAVSILIALIILLLISDNSYKKKVEDRTTFEKVINKIFEYTLFPVMMIYFWIVFGLIIAYALFGWFIAFLGEALR